MLALAFSISSTTAFGEVGVTQQGNDEEVMDTQTTGIEMPVRPWCGWIALTGAGNPIALLPVAGEDETYDGDAIDLAAEGQEYAIKVAPVDQDTTGTLADFSVEATDACSWFADTEVNGVNVKTTLDGNSFTAASDKNTLSVDDTSMDFTTASQNLVIDNTQEVCDGGFSFIGSPLTVSDLESATTGENVVSLDRLSTTTNSYCSWISDYTVTIPSGLRPTFGNSTYTYVGPTITNTMVYSRP
jgi:hypothetical protein